MSLESGAAGRDAFQLRERSSDDDDARETDSMLTSFSLKKIYIYIYIYSDELKNEDVALRLNSVRRLSTIALALGEERTRSELIPFLTDAQVSCLKDGTKKKSIVLVFFFHPRLTLFSLSQTSTKNSKDDEDEVLLAMAEELARFVPLVGGPQHAASLLPPLEALAAVEETVVRDAAVASIKAIAADVEVDPSSASAASELLTPLLRRLAGGDWFTARVSAAALLPTAYARAPASERPALRQLFAALARDDTPMVRRAAAAALPAFAAECGPADARADVLPCFHELTKDDQDSVRLLAVGCCGPLARLFGGSSSSSATTAAGTDAVPSTSSSSSEILPVVLKFAADASWRVRYNVAQQIPEMANAMPKAESGGGDKSGGGSGGNGAGNNSNGRTELLQAYLGLLRDPEAEVRVAAAARVADVCGALSSSSSDPPPSSAAATTGDAPSASASASSPPSSVSAQLLPVVAELAADASQHVRGALASVATELAPRLGREATIESLLPVLLRLLGDEAPEVRLAVISRLETVTRVVGIDLLAASLLPAVEELADDRHWRVRLAVIESTPSLAASLGAAAFAERLAPRCLGWLSDPVAAVRDAAGGCLARLAAEFGGDWAAAALLPPVLEAARGDAHYLRRGAALAAAAALAPSLSHEALASTLLPAVAAAARDAVPNVRFCAAKQLERLAPLLDAAERERAVRPTLAALAADGDADVRFFANRALASCDGVAAA